MILNLEDKSPQDRYVPDVIGYNFSVLMPDPYSSRSVRKGPALRPVSLGRLADGFAQASIENLTRGGAAGGTGSDFANFRVGDQWRIVVQGGAPNSGVSLNASFRGMRLPFSGMQDLALSAWLGRFTFGLDGDDIIGHTDSSGSWTQTGTFNSAQTGHWVLNLNIGGKYAGLDFSVADANGVVPSDTPDVVPGGSAYYLQASNQAPARQYTAAELTAMSQVPAKPNQSVAPTTPITTIPTLPSGVSTRQMLTSAYTPSFGGAGSPAAGGGSAQLIPGVDNTKLLVGAGLLVAVLMAVKK